jgi:putative endonuclease
MRDESRLVFVEVRYRRRSRFTSAAGSVTQQKQKRLEKCAKLFRKQHQKWSDFPCRFDVIAYDEDTQAPHAIWLCAVFESTD